MIEDIQFEYESRPQASSRRTPLPPPVQAQQPRREYQPQPPQPQVPRQQPLQQPRVETIVQPDESIDPFESATFADRRALARAQPSPPHVAPMQQQRAQPLEYSVSTDASSEAHSEDEDVEESQLFPGSDLF